MNDTKRFHVDFIDSGNCQIISHEVYASNIAIATETSAKIFRNVLTNTQKRDVEKIVVYFA